MDSEVYSNTGGQMSKATPLSAQAQFAAGGEGRKKKVEVSQASGEMVAGGGEKIKFIPFTYD